MAFCQPDTAIEALENDDLIDLLRRDVLDLSMKINGMSAVVESVSAIDAQAPNDVTTTASYADLAMSLGKLTQAFKTLHSYGVLGFESEPKDRIPKPN